jgi:hypothetical protein
MASACCYPLSIRFQTPDQSAGISIIFDRLVKITNLQWLSSTTTNVLSLYVGTDLQYFRQQDPNSVVVIGPVHSAVGLVSVLNVALAKNFFIWSRANSGTNQGRVPLTPGFYHGDALVTRKLDFFVGGANGSAQNVVTLCYEFL